MDVVQEKFSLFDRGVDEYIDFCREHDVTFQAYSVLERGILTGTFTRSVEAKPGQGVYGMQWFAPERREGVMKLLSKIEEIARECDSTVPAVAISYVLGTGAHLNAICGGRKPEHIAQTAKGADLDLTCAQRAAIVAAVDALHEEYGCLTHKF